MMMTEKRYRIDGHVHLLAIDNEKHKSFISRKMRKSLTFRFIKRIIGVGPRDTDAEFDQKYADYLIAQITEARFIDKAVIFSIDGNYDSKGNLDANSFIHVSNDWAIELCGLYPDLILFGASIHPQRQDALDELERCAEAGAVCVKWIPPYHNIDPSDKKHIRFYEVMKKHGMTLCSHTGYEHLLTVKNELLGDPKLLKLPLEIGLKVVACHCGMSGFYHRVEYLDDFISMAVKYDHFFGDTANLASPLRWVYMKRLLKDSRVTGKLIQGTDFPIRSMPIVWPISLGLFRAIRLQFHANAFDADYLAKKGVGFPEKHFLKGHDIFSGRRQA
ncbi:MAG: amidohydrolase family protein [Desulfatitalea sp.]|nr:amidohydrolase family protein [Desulfatitalea sp.]